MYPEITTIDTSSLLGALTYLNIVTDGWFSIMVLFSLYAISLIAYYKARDKFAEAMAVSGYFVVIVALFFWVGTWLPIYVLIIAIALAIIGTLALLLS